MSHLLYSVSELPSRPQRWNAQTVDQTADQIVDRLSPRAPAAECPRGPPQEVRRAGQGVDQDEDSNRLRRVPSGEGVGPGRPGSLRSHGVRSAASCDVPRCHCRKPNMFVLPSLRGRNIY